MRTERVPDISPKREQTYEEAIEALKKEIQAKVSSGWGYRYDHTVYLQDVSARLYDENLILVALENKKCSTFMIVPPQFRTERVCIAAMNTLKPKEVLENIPKKQITKKMLVAALNTGAKDIIHYIPVEYFKDFDFALYAVSCCPQSVDKVLNAYRQDRTKTPYTPNDIAIIREAMCPKESGRRCMKSLRGYLLDDNDILNGRTFEQYCAEECGYVSPKHLYTVYKILQDKEV